MALPPFYTSNVIVSTLLLLSPLLGLSGCGGPAVPQADYVVTLPPLKMILEPLVAGRKTVTCVLPPGVSPHTFTLRPSVAQQLAAADAIFYADPSLDGWAIRGRTDGAISLFALVPEGLRMDYASLHSHEAHGGEGGLAHHEKNPHFWSDPVVVMALIPELVGLLTARDPEGKAIYERNAASFLDALRALDGELSVTMGGLPKASLVAFHPSWSYFFKRYGLEEIAFVEPIPGKELTPKGLLRLKTGLEHEERVIVLSERQLAQKSAVVLAEALGATLVVIDPLGGVAPMDHYPAFLHANAARIAEGFQ